jgi:hypothetical protein
VVLARKIAPCKVIIGVSTADPFAPRPSRSSVSEIVVLHFASTESERLPEPSKPRVRFARKDDIEDALRRSYAS